MFCATRLVFGGTEGVGSRIQVLRAQTHFRVFMFCATGHVFGGAEGVVSCFHVFASGLVFGGTMGVGSRFHVMRAQTRFRRYRRRQVSFSCIALPDTFSVVRTTSDPIFMIYAPGVIFGGTEGVGSRFHVVALSDSFSVVPRA
jgi:hypothetical protein